MTATPKARPTAVARPTRPPRVETVLNELDRAASEYQDAKDRYEAARVRFQSSSERFASIRKLADAVLTSADLFRWSSRHPEVRYAGLGPAEAVESYLRTEAYSAASQFSEKQTKTYQPWRTLDRIIDALERGGFEFRTTSAAREINATLTNLSTVAKNDQMPSYAIAEYAAILKLYIGEPTSEEEDEPDDLPF